MPAIGPLVLQFTHPQPIQEIKAAGDGTWEVSGYVSTFGSVDLGGDTILRGAFDASLASGRKVKFLFAHDQSQVLGVPISLKADDHGLFGRFKISRTRLGEDVHTLLKDGAIDSFSIGYFPEDYEFDPDTGTRILKQITVLEASAVAIPMNADALVTNVKAATLARMTMDEEAHAITTSIKSFLERCDDLASLRTGQGRSPLSSAVIERLKTVRTAADELLSKQAVVVADAEVVVVATPPAVETIDTPPPPASSSLATTIALKRARLRHAGLLENPS